MAFTLANAIALLDSIEVPKDVLPGRTGAGRGDPEPWAYLDRSGELRRRHKASREAWVLELFTRRYGSLGSERLGGLQAARARIAELPGSALDAFSELANQAGVDA